MLRSLIPLLLALLPGFFSVHGQDSIKNSLDRLLPGSHLPPEFLFAADIGDVHSHGKDEQLSTKELREFNLSNDLAVGRIVKSARLLFDDPVTEYLSAILNILLKDNPDLRKNIHVYSYKSATPNAFMMPNGMLFVNLGLVANATTEADLAFVLSHELVHFTEGHSIDLYLEGLRRDSKEDDIVADYLDHHYRSRLQETEADKRGINDFLLKSPYSTAAVSMAFDIMQYGHLPFDEIPFERKEVETSFFYFPDEYFTPVVNVIRTEEAYLDTLSSHPNVNERRLLARVYLDKADDRERKDFIQPEEKFRYIRDLARFECIRQHLVNGEFIEAFYNTRILEKDYPSDRNLARARVAAIYGISKIRQSGSMARLPKEKDAQGEIHGVVRFFRSVEKREIMLLALREAWRNRQVFADDDYMESVFGDIVADLYRNHEMELADFSDFGMDDTSWVSLAGKENGFSGKYDAARANNTVIPQKEWEPYRYMLADLKQDPSFVAAYNAGILAFKESQLARLAKKRKSNSEIRRAPAGMVFMEPGCYLETRSTKGMKTALRKDRSRFKSVQRSLMACAPPLNIKAVQANAYSASERMNYRTYSLYRELMQEVRENAELKMITWTSAGPGEGMNEKYIVMLNQASRQKNTLDRCMPLYSLMTIFQYPLLPVGVYNLFIPSYESELAFACVDLRSGRVVYSNSASFDEKLRGDYVTDFAYRSLYNAKKEILSNN